MTVSHALALPRARSRRLRTAALATAVAVAIGVLGTPLSASATTASNPLAGAGGFTVVSFGDIELSNHELEGSIAAAGDARTTSSSPYNVIHAAAGSSAYTLPTYNGVPVRVVLGGGFDVAGSTSMIRVSSGGSTGAATEGRVVVGSTTGAAVAARGSGVCIQDAARTDCGGAVLEQSNFSQTTASAVDANAFSTVITASGKADLIAASAAIADGKLVGTVATPALSGSGMERDLTLVAGSVNVWTVNPTDLPTGDWKLRFPAAKPSATTPLVIRVQAADNATLNLPMETIDAYAAPGSSTNNAFAPYMLWNIEQSSGNTVNLVGNGIIPGSFLAPLSELVTPDHSSKTLIEGQVVAASIVFRHQGEVHHYGFTPTLDFDLDPGNGGGNPGGTPGGNNGGNTPGGNNGGNTPGGNNGGNTPGGNLGGNNGGTPGNLDDAAANAALTLPNTGAQVGGLAGAAVLLVALGGLAVLVSRRMLRRVS